MRKRQNENSSNKAEKIYLKPVFSKRISLIQFLIFQYCVLYVKMDAPATF